MSTNWALPRTISQYAEAGAESLHVRWNENFTSLNSVNGKSIKTARDLVHIARDPKHDILEKTYFLKLTNFNFENIPTTLSGIELKLTMNRYGRVTDDTIQLILNDNIIGDNFANESLLPISFYGDLTEKWNTSLSINNVRDSSFGVIIRFKSHPFWPHKSSPYIDGVELRLH